MVDYRWLNGESQTLYAISKGAPLLLRNGWEWNRDSGRFDALLPNEDVVPRCRFYEPDATAPDGATYRYASDWSRVWDRINSVRQSYLNQPPVYPANDAAHVDSPVISTWPMVRDSNGTSYTARVDALRTALGWPAFEWGSSIPDGSVRAPLTLASLEAAWRAAPQMWTQGAGVAAMLWRRWSSFDLEATPPDPDDNAAWSIYWREQLADWDRRQTGLFQPYGSWAWWAASGQTPLTAGIRYRDALQSRQYMVQQRAIVKIWGQPEGSPAGNPFDGAGSLRRYLLPIGRVDGAWTGSVSVARYTAAPPLETWNWETAYAAWAADAETLATFDAGDLLGNDRTYALALELEQEPTPQQPVYLRLTSTHTQGDGTQDLYDMVCNGPLVGLGTAVTLARTWEDA